MNQQPQSDVYPMRDTAGKWHPQAACSGQNPEKWYVTHDDMKPPPKRRQVPDRLASLRRVCAGCPVAIECLEEGLAECRMSAKSNDTIGTRAGTTAGGRHRIYMMWRAGDLDGIRAELVDARWKPEQADEFIAQMPPSQRKTCPHCGVVKPTVTGFYRNKRSPDGRATWCKDCAKGSVRNGRSGESE